MTVNTGRSPARTPKRAAGARPTASDAHDDGALAIECTARRNIRVLTISKCAPARLAPAGLRQRDVVAERSAPGLRNDRRRLAASRWRERGGGGIGCGHDSADGDFDAGTRGGRGILAKLLVVCQLRSMCAVAAPASPNSVTSDEQDEADDQRGAALRADLMAARLRKCDGALDEQAPLLRVGGRRREGDVGVRQRCDRR